MSDTIKNIISKLKDPLKRRKCAKTKNSIDRRKFLKIAGLSSLASMVIPFKSKVAGATSYCDRNWWHDRAVYSTSEGTNKHVDYCRQDNLDASRVASDGIIQARLDNNWSSFKIRALPQEFMEWGVSDRYFYYNSRLNSGGGMPSAFKNGGIHHGMVATYGNRFGRGDSAFHCNIATKGTALCPTREKILELLPVLQDLKEANPPDKIQQYYQIMISQYSDINNFDATKLITLELYTQGSLASYGYKETHTFANMMANPTCSIGFMQQEYPNPNLFNPAVSNPDPSNTSDYTSFGYGLHYKVQTIPEILHCWAPGNGDEYDVFNYNNATNDAALYAYWTNFLHTFYHGGRANVTAVVYHVVEAFKNTPGSGGRGLRVVPALA